MQKVQKIAKRKKNSRKVNRTKRITVIATCSLGQVETAAPTHTVRDATGSAFRDRKQSTEITFAQKGECWLPMPRYYFSYSCFMRTSDQAQHAASPVTRFPWLACVTALIRLRRTLDLTINTVPPLPRNTGISALCCRYETAKGVAAICGDAAFRTTGGIWLDVSGRVESCCFSNPCCVRFMGGTDR